ncbi:hypothetical protein EXIGLDRAFT_829374 [Exidia glandulosa HHB12029]|uniref:Uncharacterized protein n=1 Tax=Exidia glandulosa HHB12029 TaxID=1314781 RepID=A0A165PQ19_EXIGL|nr:hypothetical protein EXIGLDRAFT_829374 [Exidia glandulosa HHB12029]
MLAQPQSQSQAPHVHTHAPPFYRPVKRWVPWDTGVREAFHQPGWIGLEQQQQREQEPHPPPPPQLVQERHEQRQDRQYRTQQFAVQQEQQRLHNQQQSQQHRELQQFRGRPIAPLPPRPESNLPPWPLPVFPRKTRVRHRKSNWKKSVNDLTSVMQAAIPAPYASNTRDYSVLYDTGDPEESSARVDEREGEALVRGLLGADDHDVGDGTRSRFSDDMSLASDTEEEGDVTIKPATAVPLPQPVPVPVVKFRDLTNTPRILSILSKPSPSPTSTSTVKPPPAPAPVNDLARQHWEHALKGEFEASQTPRLSLLDCPKRTPEVRMAYAWNWKAIWIRGHLEPVPWYTEKGREMLRLEQDCVMHRRRR